MSSHDALTERGGGRSWRERLRLAWRALAAGASGRSRTVRARAGYPQARRPSGRHLTAGPRQLLTTSPGPSARQVSRKLSPIERTLSREAPDLVGLFGVFTQLAEGDPAGGVEQLPEKSWPRPRPAAIAVLLALASVVALCLTLSTQMGPVSRSCYVPGTAAPVSGTTATLNGTTALSGAGALNDSGAVNGVPCGLYDNNK